MMKDSVVTQTVVSISTALHEEQEWNTCAANGTEWWSEKQVAHQKFLKGTVKQRCTLSAVMFLAHIVFAPQVFLAKWRDHTVVYNAMLTPKYKDDFHHGLKMVTGLQSNPEVQHSQLEIWHERPKYFAAAITMHFRGGWHISGDGVSVRGGMSVEGSGISLGGGGLTLVLTW